MKEKLLTKEIAKQFRSRKINTLNEFTSIDAAAVKALALCSRDISLSGLTSLSDDAAKALGSFMGREINLDGLRSLSDEASKALGSFMESELRLDELTSLSGAADNDPSNNEEAEVSQDCDSAESDQEDIASKGSQTPLIAALAVGNIAEAERLRAGGARIYEEAETLNGFFASLWEEHLLRMFSRPVNPDILPRTVSLKDVIKSCGPIYESGGACFSLSQRPSGWASAVKAQRVLSWHDSGFGLVGDQAVDINLRLVSAKPLTAYADSIIAGPLPEDGFPEMPKGFIQDKQTTRERRKLPTREEAHRLFYNLVVCQMDLDWTKDLTQYQCLRQPALQLLAEEGQKLSGGNDARMEFSLFGDIGDRKKSLKKLAAADPAVAGLTLLLLLAGDCVSALEEMKKISAILKRHSKTKPVTKWEVALWDISLLCLQAADGKTVNVADVEAFLPFLRNPGEPALSIQIERTCSALCGHIASLFMENHDFMDSVLAHRMCKCGWRPPAGSILMSAIDAENADFLKYLLSYGMYPKGHPGGGINLVPLATAAMRGNKDAVKLLLDAGADPLEPSHYGGASTLQQARWNCANLEVGEKEKACLKVLEKAVKNDTRIHWLAPEMEDSE